MAFTIEEIDTGLRRCYEIPTGDPPASDPMARIKPFWWLPCNLVAWVKSDSEKVFVVFQGTVFKEFGTWLRLNFQAASTRFLVVDKSLTTCAGQMPLKLQAENAHTIAPGVVHQGFLRELYTWRTLLQRNDIAGRRDRHRHNPVILKTRQPQNVLLR